MSNIQTVSYTHLDVYKRQGLNCKEPKEFIEIMTIIDRDLHLGLTKNEKQIFKPIVTAIHEPVPPAKKKRPYTTIQRVFTAAELAYWNKYGITPDILKRFKVTSLLKFSSENNERKPFSFSSTAKEPIYGYTGKQHIKTVSYTHLPFP